MAKPYAPCKDCPDRHEACHGHCEKFINYRKAVDEWNQRADGDLVRREMDAYEARRSHRLWKMTHPNKK